MAEGVVEDKKAPEPPQVEGKKFTPEQRELLGGSFEILELTGKSYEEILAAYPNIAFSRDFERYGECTPGNKMMDHLEGLKSKSTEVAIPRYDSIFLADSNRSQENQKRMIDESSEELAKEVPGVKRIMGGTLDHVELGAQYSERHNGASLYGRWTDRKQATTEDGFYVGSMPKQGQNSAEINISHMRGGPNNEGPWAAPLVVPA